VEIAERHYSHLAPCDSEIDIDEEVFRMMLKHAGTFIGLGRWAPRNAGLYGRFAVKNVTLQNGKV
jgi:hypothetical protein